jgi:NADH-quinone oxidoreductase subunit A
VLINLIFTTLLVLAFASVSRLLGGKSRQIGEGELPYETGMRPIEPAIERMTVPYIRYALLFVLFDIETAFLLPWVQLRGLLDPTLMASFTLFIALLSFLLAYVWKKGVLRVS